MIRDSFYFFNFTKAPNLLNGTCDKFPLSDLLLKMSISVFAKEYNSTWVYDGISTSYYRRAHGGKAGRLSPKNSSSGTRGFKHLYIT